MSYINRDYKWPYNLAYDILGDDKRFKDLLPYYLEDAVKVNLSARECKIIYLRYFHNKSYDELGKEFCVTRERIRQIQARAIRRLRYLENRYMGIRRCDYNMVVQENVNLTLQMKQANDYAEPNDEVKVKLTAFLDTPIEDLGLSVRSYNCLAKRSTFSIYRDFQNFKIADLFRIRNLGNKSMTEILDKLDAIGFKACSGDHILDLAEWFTNSEKYPDAMFVWKGEKDD